MTNVLCSGEFKNKGGKCPYSNCCIYHHLNHNLREEVTGYSIGGVVMPAEKGCNKTPAASSDCVIDTAGEEVMYSVLCTLRDEEGLDFPLYPPTKKQLRRIWAAYSKKERREYILEIVDECKDDFKHYLDGREVYQFKLMQDETVYCDTNEYDTLFNAREFSKFFEIFYAES